MRSKNLLTVLSPSCNNESAITKRAGSGLRRDAGRRFLVLGLTKPECLPVVRLGAALLGRRNTRAFLFALNAKTKRRCHMAQINFRQSFLEANHALLQIKSLITISQEAYTDPETENVYNLLGVIDEKLSIGLDFFDNNDLCWIKEELQ
jgi:hypothetical protein